MWKITHVSSYKSEGQLRHDIANEEINGVEQKNNINTSTIEMKEKLTEKTWKKGKDGHPYIKEIKRINLHK